jgi:general nucleoside transport system permease protein
MHGLWTGVNDPVVAGFLSASMRLAAPIMLAALGGMFSERSGILNIGLEGMMLAGSLVGFAAGYFSSNLWVGSLAAILVGAALGLLLGFYTISLASNQVVAGIALNLLVVGVTGFAYRALFGTGTRQPRIDSFPPLKIPLVGDIPLLGPLFFQQGALVYLALALVAVSWVALFRTSWGLRVIAVGEHPRAAETAGVNVPRTRYLCLAIGGALAGMGGAFLSLSATGVFLDNMTAGRGYIALAILILGRRRPFGILGAALLFGAADALQLRAQLLPIGVPFQFMLMLPYVLTIVVLAGFVRRVDAPAALGVPYRRDRTGGEA